MCTLIRGIFETAVSHATDLYSSFTPLLEFETSSNTAASLEVNLNVAAKLSVFLAFMSYTLSNDMIYVKLNTVNSPGNKAIFKISGPYFKNLRKESLLSHTLSRNQPNTITMKPTASNLHLNLWLEGRMPNSTAISPIRVVATPDASCNLACEHCYWKHDIPNGPADIDWSPAVKRIHQFNESALQNGSSLQVVYAGRVLSKRGARFLDALAQSPIDFTLGIIDNGYTVFNRLDFLPKYQYINISVDGWRTGHDRQRKKEGSFDVAWGAILKLKSMGYDPISASALGPLTWPGWEKFESMLAEHDVRSSTTFVWDMEATAARKVASITSDTELIRIFETLVNGVPKLINLYDLNHVKTLMPFLRQLSWSADQYSGDGIVAECNGSKILYRPSAPAFFREIEVLWDGSFQTVESCGRASIDSITESHLQHIFSLALREREAWKDVSITTQPAL